MRVLVIAHGHPKFSKGGGEIAAYNHYLALKEAGHEASFLGWNNRAYENNHARSVEQLSESEWLISTRVDFFTFSSVNGEAVEGYELLLDALKPEVIHFHHFIHLGIELPTLTRKALPAAKIYMTLHEFLLICHNNGQMITPNGELCSEPSPSACNRCFPTISTESFFMREGYLKNCLASVDHFYSPSNFLRDRIIQWGLPPERISYSPNTLGLHRINVGKRSGSRANFGFFGQINPYKGLDLLLDAFALVSKKVPRAKLYINGVMSSVNKPDYVERINSKIESLGSSVRMNGPYSPEELPSRLDQVGWVTMSSRWWENSPVVIQEAFASRKPIIVPNIGGMSEQLSATGFGLSYQVSNVESLADSMIEAANMSEEHYRALLSKAPTLKTDSQIIQNLGIYF